MHARTSREAIFPPPQRAHHTPRLPLWEAIPWLWRYRVQLLPMKLVNLTFKQRPSLDIYLTKAPYVKEAENKAGTHKHHYTTYIFLHRVVLNIVIAVGMREP